VTEHFFSNPDANFIYNINAQFHRVYGAKGREGIKLQLNMNYTMLRERWDPPAAADLVERAQRIWDPAGGLGLQTGGPWFRSSGGLGKI
jgi:hypothetical protein